MFWIADDPVKHLKYDMALIWMTFVKCINYNCCRAYSCKRQDQVFGFQSCEMRGLKPTSLSFWALLMALVCSWFEKRTICLWNWELLDNRSQQFNRIGALWFLQLSGTIEVRKWDGIKRLSSLIRVLWFEFSDYICTFFIRPVRLAENIPHCLHELCLTAIICSSCQRSW